jgi:hypothetical protein
MTRLAICFFLVLVGIGTSLVAARSYGQGEYRRGRAELALEVAKTTRLADETQRATELKQQGTINALASRLVVAQTDLNRAEGSLRAAGGGLRDDILAAADRGAICPSGDPAATARADGPAAALGDISVACSVLAEGLAGEAESLANTVRSLQSYATAVSTP